MSEPMWLDGDDVALGIVECDDCGYSHDVGDECIEEDPDTLHDEIAEDW